MPVLVLFGLALTADAGIWGHLARTVLPGYAANTAILLLTVGTGVAVIGTGTAWLTTMCRFPGRRLFEWALLLPLACPAYVIGLVYIELLDYSGTLQHALRGLFGWQRPDDYWFPDIRTVGGAAAMLILVLYPYVYLLARAAFLDTSVSALEAARTLGLTPGQAFRRISLPMARPAIAIGMALALMEVLADFGTVQIFAVDTFTTGIYDVWLGLHDVHAASQLALLLLALVLLLVWLEWSSRRGRRFHNAGRHYRDLPRLHLSGWLGAAACVACLLPLTLGFLVPSVVLVDWALWTLPRLRLEDYVSDLTNTLTVAASAAVLAVLVALFLCYAMRLSNRRLLVAAARLAGAGYALPGAVLAVGVLISLGAIDNTLDAWSKTWFGGGTGLLLSGTVVAVIFAYLVRFMALSLGSVESSLMRVTRNMDGAARTLGHGPGSTLLRVHVPLIRTGLLTGLLIVFVDCMKELPATLMLRPFNFSTLATRVYEYASNEAFQEAGLWALSIVLAGLLPVILLSYSITHGRPSEQAGH